MSSKPRANNSRYFSPSVGRGRAAILARDLWDRDLFYSMAITGVLGILLNVRLRTDPSPHDVLEAAIGAASAITPIVAGTVFTVEVALLAVSHQITPRLLFKKLYTNGREQFRFESYYWVFVFPILLAILAFLGYVIEFLSGPLPSAAAGILLLPRTVLLVWMILAMFESVLQVYKGLSTSARTD